MNKAEYWECVTAPEQQEARNRAYSTLLERVNETELDKAVIQDAMRTVKRDKRLTIRPTHRLVTPPKTEGGTP